MGTQTQKTIELLGLNGTSATALRDMIDDAAKENDAKILKDTKLEVVRLMLREAYEYPTSISRDIIKSHLNSYDLALLGVEACSVPHTHCKEALSWLREPYLSTKLEGRIHDAAFAELIQGNL